jgi:hypothetical protein
MKLTVTVPVQETREVELTEKYYKSNYGEQFFRINEDETVTSIEIYEYSGSIISLKIPSIFGEFYAYNVIPSTEQEFQAAFNKALKSLKLL